MVVIGDVTRQYRGGHELSAGEELSRTLDSFQTYHSLLEFSEPNEESEHSTASKKEPSANSQECFFWTPRPQPSPF